LNEERAIVRSDQGRLPELVVAPKCGLQAEVDSGLAALNLDYELVRRENLIEFPKEEWPIRRDVAFNLGLTLLKFPQEEAPLRHYFAPGVYLREIFMAKGLVIVGKIHRTEHPNIISKGKCIVAPERDLRLVEAPCTFISPPGIQKVLIILEDTVWTTVHVTEETDVEKIEAYLAAPDYDDPLLVSILTERAIRAAKEVSQI